jgi:diguanylate cyclase
LRERAGDLAQVPLNELLLTLLAFTSIVVATGLVLVALVQERGRAAPTSRTAARELQRAARHLRQPITPTLEKDLERALERQEFALHYQPKVDLDSRRIVGLEALLRWNSPARGSVPPMHFIPLLEETGLILEVGRWVLRRALLDLQGWAAAGLSLPRIAVNVSPVELRQRDFVALVLDAFGPATQSPLIDLELTETLVMENVEDSIEKLTRIRGRGIGVAIDDFGTGYSSLAYLTKLPAQTLKIDRFFIDRMLHDDQNMTLVQTIISLAQALGLTTVAEGVESEEQADVLEMLRCDQMQGYLVSRPLPAAEISRLLALA